MTNNKTKGIFFIILSAFFFALMNLFVRLSGDLPPMQKSFFRNLVALAFAVIVLLRTEEKFQFNHKNLPQLIARATFGTLGILCNYYAIDHLVLSDASMLNKLSPFFAILVSYFYLKEKVTPVQISAVIIAFLGALCIIKPGFSSMNSFPALIGALGGLGAGTAYTMVRKLSLNGERGPFIVFFFLSVLPAVFDFRIPSDDIPAVGFSASGGSFRCRRTVFHYRCVCQRTGAGNFRIRLLADYLCRPVRFSVFAANSGYAFRGRLSHHLRNFCRHVLL